jgi:hypothetical protein
LREEILKNIATTNENLATEKSERKQDVESATKRKDAIQILIDELQKYNKDVVAEDLLRTKDLLHSD